MNVLSLFDGFSCGQIALSRLRVKPVKYYASELDKYAITVTQANYPDTIQLGDVTRWREWDSISNCHYRKLTPLECERLQTVPDNHTNHVSNTQRYKMLGNGWTIDVIAHIFKKLIRG